MFGKIFSNGGKKPKSKRPPTGMLKEPKPKRKVVANKPRTNTAQKTSLRASIEKTDIAKAIQAEDLAEIVHSKEPEVRKIIERSGGVDCIVDTKLDVWAVFPETGTTEAAALSELIRSLTRIKPGDVPVKVTEVTPRAFETYKRSSTTEQRVKAQVARNENVDTLLVTAITEGASDIHIRRRAGKADILLRVNQVLRPFEHGNDGALVESMVRAMWNNYRDQGDKRPDWNPREVEDTSFPFRPQGDNKTAYMVRCSSVPEKRGFKAVLRLRDTKELMPLELMGYTERQLRDIMEMADMKQGLSVITGPTNSGKSTTLTTLMASIPPKFAVIEVADPIEVVLANVEHFEVNNDSEEQMRKYLKACVRQDPDYLIIGELRSKTTIDAATTMAFAGTSVMSTLHTNSVPASIPRMLQFGLSEDTVNIKGFLNGVVSQNLIPVLCSCKADRVLDRRLSQAMRTVTQDKYRELFQSDTVYFENPEGCSKCKGTGIKSITLIAEVLKMNDDTLKILEKKDYNGLAEYMIAQKIPTKHHHAAGKIMEGMFDPRHCEQRIEKFSKANLAAFHQ